MLNLCSNVEIHVLNLCVNTFAAAVLFLNAAIAIRQSLYITIRNIRVTHSVGLGHQFHIFNKKCFVLISIRKDKHLKNNKAVLSKILICFCCIVLIDQDYKELCYLHFYKRN